MKPLDKLSNVDRARILFELFPADMPAFISFVAELTQAIIKEPATLKSKVIEQIHTAEFWLDLVHQAKRKLDEYGSQLSKRSRLFCEQLFDGDACIYAGYCLHQYIVKEEGLNRKFKQAVFLLFF